MCLEVIAFDHIDFFNFTEILFCFECFLLLVKYANLLIKYLFIKILLTFSNVIL